ncbi:hypothetical protein QYE76_005293 [Lolium multiflorum]|uniref:Retrotransposon gag domain-containing protein n=1 Tax=Lolium multiflorum TaxID=4521 RepID=A0AAD8W305_LOLMU|nr:hypothetical protein QYE76_005293 [Lolium multiflorum]
MMPKRKAFGYTKPYPNSYELIPLPPKYRLPDFTKFSGSEGSSSIEHVSRYLAQLGTISASDELRLEEQFHEQYHSEASESSIADLAQLRQKRGETVTEYIQRFRNLRNRCYSVRITEKEAVELAVAGLATQLKDMASQADYPSLAHVVQKLSAYEQRHPDLYQDKFKRAVALVDAEEDEVPAGDQEVAVAEWTRGGTPVSCKWVKPPGPPRGFDFDVTKTEQIFDLLLKEKQLKIPEGLKFPTAQELNGKPYCKWHNSLSHATNDCRVWRQHIQAAIENGRLIFNQYAMKVDTQPFPAVNMVEYACHAGCQPGFLCNINMVDLGHHAGKDGDEGSCSHSKDTEEAAPRDRLRQDGKRYVTEGEVKNIRYQRPLSDHLLNKYNRDEEEHERCAKGKAREQDDEDRHWDCPFFRHCWDSGMSRLPTIGNCPECNRKKEAANVSVFERLGPLPPQSKRAESPRLEDLEDSEDEGEEEDRSYLRAVTALVVAVVAAVGAAPGGIVVAPMAADRALVVLVFFVSIILIAVEVAPGPGGTAWRRLVGGLSSSSSSSSSSSTPLEEVKSSQEKRSSSLSSSDSPSARKRRSLSPSVEDWSSSDQMEKSWSDSSPAAMARRCWPHGPPLGCTPASAHGTWRTGWKDPMEQRRKKT